MRTIIICLLVLAILFLGHAMYDRTVADRRLAKAVEQLPGDPMGSYQTIKEPLGYNRLVAMGKIGDVQAAWLKALELKVTGEFSRQPPAANAYPQAEQALAALDEMHATFGVNVDKLKLAIIQAARDSVPALKEKGSLKGWDNMISMFQNLSGNSSQLTGVFENFNKWFEEAKAVPRRPFGVRDAISEASQAAGNALEALGLDLSAQAGKPVAPAPANATDRQFINAEKALGSAQDALKNFMTTFGENETPQELAALRAKIAYNMGAIKLAYFQDHRANVKQAGGDYLVEFLVRTDTDTVPSPNEMVDQWQGLAQREFEEAMKYFTASTLEGPMKQAYSALALWSNGQLATVFSNTPPPPAVQAQVAQMSAGLTGKAGEIIQALRSTPRALLIVEVP